MKRKEKYNFKHLYRFLAVFFLFMIFLFGSSFLYTEDLIFSEAENRILETLPNFTGQSFLDGRYQQKWEQFVSDQFPFRNIGVRIKSAAERLIGKTKINDVYIGKHGYLLEDLKSPDPERLKATLNSIQAFSANYPAIKSSVMIIPNAANILSDYLPPFAPVADQEKQLEILGEGLDKNTAYINVSPILRKNKEKGLYYRTDHHWTTLGAYYAYLWAAPQLGIDIHKELFHPYTITNHFSGTLASKSGFSGKKDKMQIFLPKSGNEKLAVTYLEEKKVFPTLYHSKNLEKKDKYTVFLDGNHPVIEIKTLAMNNRRLLLFKDSYANCFIPFLTPHFQEIAVIDPRYYYGDLKEFMEHKNFTDALFLYNANTFFEDSALASVLDYESPGK